jgi:hypothetical protein
VPFNNWAAVTALPLTDTLAVPWWITGILQVPSAEGTIEAGIVAATRVLPFAKITALPQ